MKLNNALIIYMKPSSSKEKKTLLHVKKILRKFKIGFILKERNKKTRENFKDRDFVVVVGGDGTFLGTSHFIEDKRCVLGVNSNPEKKEGFFMCCDMNNFESKLKLFLNGKSRILKLNRLETTLAGKKIDLALNEIFIGAKRPYKVSLYYLRIGKQKEYHKSSGIIVGTASGSYAWLSSAGGKKLPLTSKKFQLVVREPYQGNLHKTKIKNIIFGPNDIVEVRSGMMDGVVAVDSVNPEYKFSEGRILRIRTSDKQLYVVK